MRFRQSRKRSFVTAKNFTIAMVVVNAAGLLAVQQKLKQAEVPDAYALDDGARAVVARSDAFLPDRQVLPQIALTAPPASTPAESLVALPSIKPLPIVDLAALELDPVGSPEQTASARPQRELALASDKAAARRPGHRRLDIAVPVARPSSGSSFSSAFDSGLEAPSQVGLATPADAVAATFGAAPGPVPSMAEPVSHEAAPPAQESATPTEAVPRIDPSASQFFPAAPADEAPAELPAAA